MKPTILVIEDEPLGARLAQVILTSQGYEVAIVSDGIRGLEASRADAPALILLDLMLPGIDGYEILDRLKSDPQTASIPVVVLSARAHEAEISRATEAGATAYVSKPYRKAELLETVGSILRA